MAFHFSLDPDEMESITAQYEIVPTSFEPLAGGWGNSSFEVSTPEGRYILTVFDTLPFDRVESLAELLRHLGTNGFPTSPVVQRLDGRFSTRVRGKPVLIKRFLQGRVVDRLNPMQLGQVGAALARLHLLPPPQSMQRGHSFDSEFYQQVVTAAEGTEFARWIRAQRSVFESCVDQQQPGLPAGLTHGDLFYDNVLFDDQQLAAVIDFEEACHHWLVFDLGMAAVGLAASASRLRLDDVRHLLEGYREVRPLDPREVALLVPSIAYAAAGTACWRYWKYCLDDPSLGLEKRYLEMVELAEAVTRTVTEESLLPA